METKILLFNADDFGQSPGINQGIIRSFENGLVLNTSLMTRYKYSEPATEYAKSNPRLDVGLHIDLGEWKLSNNEWIAVYEVVPMNNTEKIKTEIYWQIEKFIKLMGVPPTHLDSHQHTHLRKHILPIVQNFAAELNIPLRSCTNSIKYCGKFYGQTNECITDLDMITTSALKVIIDDLEPGITEVACHPALETDIETMYMHERILELQTLCDPTIIDYLASKNIIISTFTAVSDEIMSLTFIE
jgi:predicted glycoside hydrolase/deacetylase ChbG (UPF0249 family)